MAQTYEGTWVKETRAISMTEEEIKRAKLIALFVTLGISAGFSIWAATDAYTKTHSGSRAFGAFLMPPVWLLTR